MSYSFTIKNKKELFDNLNDFEKDINELNTDICNVIVLQTAQNANFLTLKTTEGKIISDMNKPSFSGGSSTLGQALVNSKRKSQGLPRLKGSSLDNAVSNLIAAKIFSITYLKSGWMPSIKYLDKLVKKSKYYSIIKRYSFKTDPLTRNIGTDKGDFVYAKINSTKKYAMALNSTGDGHDKSSAMRVLEEGLMEAFVDVKIQWSKFSTIMYLKLLEKYK